MSQGFRKKFIGDRQFYKTVLSMVVPMILQYMITNFVSMIDNIMVGQIGTAQMSGVSVVNQFIFVFNVTIFGAVSGAGIFGAQFFGKGDSEGQKHTFRFRLYICGIIAVIGILVYGIFDRELITLFLSEDDEPQLIADTLESGRQYMRIMLLCLLPFSVGQAYSSVISECGHTKIPMIGSMSAVGVNVLLDYCLIFGHFGFPEMGVKGAAWATVISKYIEALVKIVWAHSHKEKNKYIIGVFKGFSIPKSLTADIIKKGMPLLLNEFLWAAGMSVIAQFYSVRGIEAVAARNISGTITNLFGAVYIQLGACISIMVGAKLGANKLKEARELDNKLIFFAVTAAAGVALFAMPLAGFFPMLYKTEESIRSLAGYMIVIQCMCMPLWAFTNASYFTLRSGGKTWITFFYDFAFTWVLVIPLGAFLSYHTSVDIRILFAVLSFSEIVKVVLGYFMVRSDMWINNIVGTETADSK